jgi:hypothetical protein
MLALPAFTLHAESPNGIVRGRVVNAKNQPVEFATAALVNLKSGQLEKGTICNERGEFSIENVVRGEYYLTVRMMGYDSVQTEAIVIDRKNRAVEKIIVLKESSRQLGEVTITAKQEFVEQAVDKVIINPNASITTSSENVFDILKKIPGVTIDNNDNISLKGMQGVIVMIDDKQTHLSAKELAALLQGMQGKNVRTIEIIENPSARFDAEGNSGIINIKTAHSRAPGFNGSLNTGITFTRSVGGNGGVNLNMNYGKVNVYGNYNFYDWKGWSGMDATRKFTSESLRGASQFSSTESNSDGRAHNYKIGADFFLAQNQVVSFRYKGNTGFNDMTESGSTIFSGRTGNVDSTLQNNADRNNSWNRQTFNLNYKWDIDTLGRSLMVDADYAFFAADGSSTQQSSYLDVVENSTGRNLNLNSSQLGDIDIMSAKVDYTHPINKQISLESGIKASMVTTDSRANVAGYFVQNDNFVYEEQIQAGYVSGRASFGKTSVQLGVRAENTIATGKSVSTGRNDKHEYLEFFPSFFAQQKFNPNHTAGLRYSYRIGRPNYHSLNPFVWILDPYTFNRGNPDLQPQFTHSMNLNHNYKGKFMTSLGYNFTKDLFTDVLYQNDDDRTVFQTIENFGKMTNITLSETVQLQPFTWWRLNGTVTGMYKEVNSNLPSGKIFAQWSYNGNISNSFTLPHKFSMEVNGSYFSEQLLGNFKIKSFYTIDIGLQKTILNDKGVIKAAFSDIFNTGSAGGYAKYENVDINADNYHETRRLNISFSYRFGKNEFKTRANRSTSSSEEQGRGGGNQ